MYYWSRDIIFVLCGWDYYTIILIKSWEKFQGSKCNLSHQLFLAFSSFLSTICFLYFFLLKRDHLFLLFLLERRHHLFLFLVSFFFFSSCRPITWSSKQQRRLLPFLLPRNWAVSCFLCCLSDCQSSPELLPTSVGADQGGNLKLVPWASKPPR